MEQDDRDLNYPPFSIGNKRPFVAAGHGFYQESKRQCTQSSGYDHDYGTATMSSYVPSSWEAQYGVFEGAMNTPHQPNVDTDLPGQFEPQYAAELPLWSDWPEFGPGYLTHKTLSGATPVQSSKVETYAPEFGSSAENLTDGSPCNIVTQTDSELSTECLLSGISQEDLAVMEESHATVIEEHVHKASTSPSLRYDYANILLQFGSGSLMNLEEGDQISQERWEPTSQAFADVAPEAVDTVVANEKTYLGPACVPARAVTDRYDACFGVIVADALSSFTGDQGSYLAPESNKYAGLLALPALCRLLDSFLVEFSATLIASTSKPGPTTVKKAKNRFASHECSVRIVVYGLKSERSAVGELLANASLYLQHPSATELETDAEYCNPHYLVRPGCQMPVLVELSIPSNTRTIKASEQLDEAEKSRLLRVFDSTDDFGISSPIIASPRLRSTLKAHQLTALFMMIEKECGIVENATFPSIWKLNSQPGKADEYRHRITGHRESSPRPVQGGVLADEMGLGKTLSLLALVCSSLDTLNERNTPANSGTSNATLVVTPKSTIPGWLQQINKHIHPSHLRVAVYHGSSRHRLSSILENSDLILTTYETLRSDWWADGALYAVKWHRLVLDEAHHIRNRCSQAFKAACAIHARYRWCLTGTPIQNSLDDYGALLSFLAISPFKDKSKFDFWIATPLKKGKADSLRRLKDLIRATCLRRTKRMLGDSCELPKRTERIESVEFDETDQDLYAFFKERCVKMAEGVSITKLGLPEAGQRKEGTLLSLINFLRLICDHGLQLLPRPALEAWKARDGTSISWQMMQSCRKRCRICETDIEEADFLASNGYEPRCQHWICTICALQSESTPGEEISCPKCSTSPGSGDDSSCPSPAGTLLPHSAKIEALLRNLHTEQGVKTGRRPSKPVKSVIFSCWTKMLDLIQQALQKDGFRFQRIDGRTSLENRSRAFHQFNDDPSCTIMLASIGSAGEGVDLTVANHVHLIEPYWNPMVEAQAVDRVHRIGQEREVVITRYIMLNSIETYIQRIQDEKLQLINQSIDSEHLSQDDLERGHWEKLKLSLM